MLFEDQRHEENTTGAYQVPVPGGPVTTGVLVAGGSRLRPFGPITEAAGTGHAPLLHSAATGPGTLMHNRDR